MTYTLRQMFFLSVNSVKKREKHTYLYILFMYIDTSMNPEYVGHFKFKNFDTSEVK